MLIENSKGILKSANLVRLAGQLNQAWFPVNPAVLDKVQKTLQSSGYDESRETLESDLKEDNSLYLACLRELTLLLCRESSLGFRQVGHRDLSGIIRNADNEQLKRVLLCSRSSISSHSLDSLTRVQAERLEDSYIAASAADLLSPALGIDSQVGYNSALLRQLGMTLISWNYPNVYRQALDVLKASHDGPPADFDTLIQGILGFSPGVLGAKIAQCWGLGEGVVSVISASPTLDGAITKQKNNEDIAGTLSRICAVGEALARASRPQYFASAETDWEAAEKVVRQHLGENGIRTIYERARELTERYLSFAPQLFDLGARMIDEPLASDSPRGRQRFEANLFLKNCASETREAIAPLYRDLDTTVSSELVRKLIHEVIPRLGFDCACIFMLDPTAAALSPVLKVGQPLFIRPRAVSLLDGTTQLHPIRAALTRRAPFSEEGMTRDVKKVFMTGSLGRKRGVGVLYLELSAQAPSATIRNPLVVFQAVRQCLHDLLALE